jgi:hypothetical protein
VRMVEEKAAVVARKKNCLFRSRVLSYLRSWHEGSVTEKRDSLPFLPFLLFEILV